MDSCVKCLINGGGETMSSKVEKLDVPIWQRYTMTIDEAAAYWTREASGACIRRSICTVYIDGWESCSDKAKII